MVAVQRSYFFLSGAGENCHPVKLLFYQQSDWYYHLRLQTDPRCQWAESATSYSVHARLQIEVYLYDAVAAILLSRDRNLCSVVYSITTNVTLWCSCNYSLVIETCGLLFTVWPRTWLAAITVNATTQIAFGRDQEVARYFNASIMHDFPDPPSPYKYRRRRPLWSSSSEIWDPRIWTIAVSLQGFRHLLSYAGRS